MNNHKKPLKGFLMRRLYYIHPSIQFTFIRYMTVLMSIELISFAVVLVLVGQYASEFPKDYAVYIYYGSTLLMVLLFSAMNMYFGARFSHRIAGPLVQFQRALSQAMRGDYSVRVRLRANDYLQEVSGSLNDFLQQLEDTRESETPRTLKPTPRQRESSESDVPGI